MSQIAIENEQLKVVINTKGAELASIFHKQHELEYMWCGNPAVWGKHSPVLFPIVGTLKNNRYFFEEKTYELSRHGFARDKNFEVAVCGSHAATFLLSSNNDTLQVYPFPFKFYLHYEIKGNTLIVEYEVVNTGTAPMYFSVGAHPAFAVPLAADTSYEDYYLAFEKIEPLERWPITADGLIDDAPIAVPGKGGTLPLTKALFNKDALVLKHLQSSVVSLLSSKTEHGLHFSFKGFPYMGIWATKGADFVCIEPWCGIADSAHSSQQLTEKEGIEILLPEHGWKRNWQVELF